jgi:hypothetical protein
MAMQGLQNATVTLHRVAGPGRRPFAVVRIMAPKRRNGNRKLYFDKPTAEV